MAFNNDRQDGRACDTCKHEDNDRSDYPCNGCHVYELDKWEPVESEGEDDFW